ncbi:TIGR04282 family arsenosugar biosynthesis glycosyltransferase [Arenivirga flava]|uniref:Glycosyl transferase n=1 Tax=Arenivirga flava TaxID=1930060 RepID=A0AA37XC55_9MICO|nr:DUF2064 domain-containing protein [Arenivirga flava]GMA29325.1 glycosyl transferase [Arenivirga flava]
MTTLILIAKPPLPGRAKTRLHPPLTLEEAADVAAACLADSLEFVRDAPASRRILLWDGDQPPAGAEGFEVVRQVEGSLDVRLGAVFDAVDEPCVLIGMDTPQLRFEHLAVPLGGWPDDADAVMGPASDGGWWSLGFREPTGDLLRGVPMSRDDTALQQRRRIEEAGLRLRTLATLTDVDTYDAAMEVAEADPLTRFAATFRYLDSRVALQG